MVQKPITWSDLPEVHSGEFEVHPFYDEVGDSLTVYLSDVESYRERIDRYLTVYRSIETQDVVGCHVKDVTRVLAKVKAYNIGIQTKSLTLGLFLMAMPWAAAEEGDDRLELHWRHYHEVVKPILEGAGDRKFKVPRELVKA